MLSRGVACRTYSVTQYFRCRDTPTDVLRTCKVSGRIADHLRFQDCATYPFYVELDRVGETG